MATTIPARIHHKQDDVEQLLNAQLTNRDIARRLHMDRQTVGRIRRHLGYPPAPPVPPANKDPRTLAEKFAASTTEVPGGHLVWTGYRTPAGSPCLKHDGKQKTARHVAYFLEHGEWPAGRMQPACEHDWCVAPGHCDDTATRQRDREALRFISGMPERPDRCIHDHDQAVHGRLSPGGHSYCELCKSERRHAS